MAASHAKLGVLAKAYETEVGEKLTAAEKEKAEELIEKIRTGEVSMQDLEGGACMLPLVLFILLVIVGAG